MSHKSEHSKALFEMWEIVVRYRWRFIIPAFVVIAAVLSISIFLPRKYKAVGIFERRTDMVLTEMTDRQGATQTFQNPRDSIVEEITGPPAIDEVLAKLEPKLVEQGLIRSRFDLQKLRERLLHHVVVRWDISNYQLDRIRVEYVGSHPKLSAQAVNALVKSYIHRAQSQMSNRLEESASFFKAEVSRSRLAIEKIENETLNFEIEYGDLLPENPNNIQTRLTDAKENLSETIAERNAAATRVDALTQALKGVPETVPTLIHAKNPELTRLEVKLEQAKDKLTEYLNVMKMTEAHPDIVSQREQIAALKEQISHTDAEIIAEKHFTINPKRQELELQLTTASSEHQALTQQSASLQRDMDKMNTTLEGMFSVRSTYRKLSRQQDEAQRQLAFWENNLRRVDMALAAESGDRGIEMAYIKPASASLRPVSPNLSQVLMAAIGLGFLTGGLAVFIAYRTDETFADSEQLTEYFNLPSFGAVSEIITHQHRRLRRLRRMILYPANAMVMGSVIVAITMALYLDLENPHGVSKEPATSSSIAITDELTTEATE